MNPAEKENDGSKKNAIVAIASAILVAIILVGLGYAAYVNSEISDEIAKPEVPDNSALQDAEADLPPLTKPVDGEEIQDKLDKLSDELDNEANNKQLDSNALSDEELGL